MKNIIKSLFVFSLMMVAFSCADPDLDPLQQERVKKGTLLALRGSQLDAIYFDGADYGAAFYYNALTGTEKFDYDAEFLSEDPNSLESVDVFVIKRVVSGTTVTTSRVPLTNIAGSSFAIGDYRGPSVSVSIKLSDVLSKIGATLSTAEGRSAFIKAYEGGIVMESDLNLKDGSKVTQAELVAAGLYESDQFYPAQRLVYGVEDINGSLPTATTSFRGQVSTVSGKIVRTVLPLAAGKKDTLNITFDQKLSTPPTVTFSPSGSVIAGDLIPVGTTGKSFYIPFTAGATYTGSVNFSIKGGISGEPAPLSGLKQEDAVAVAAVDNLAPQNTSFTTGTRLGKGQSATITLRYNEPLGTAPKITIAPETTGIDGVTDVATTLSADGLTATYVYEYKDVNNDASHGAATVTVVSSGADRAGNVAAAIASGTLVVDIGKGPAPIITLDPTKFDWGTQIKWSIAYATGSGNVGGSTTGSVYYVAVTSGKPAPKEFVGGDVPAFVMNVDPDSEEDPKELVVARQTGVVALTSGASGTVYSAFTPNGDLDVYVVFLSSTGVISAISQPVKVTMN